MKRRIRIKPKDRDRQKINGEWYTKPSRGKPVALTRCSGKMTESEFMSVIRACLRELSLSWPPREEALKKVRIKRKQGRSIWGYPCNKCKKIYTRKEVEVDHKVPVGSLRNLEDLPNFVERLFVEVAGWQCLCKKCHKGKTTKEGKNNLL